MDSHRKVMTQPAAVVHTGLKSSDDLPTFETKGSGESSTYSSVLTIEGKAAASTKLTKHAVGTPDISDTPEKRVSRLQSTHSGYSDSGIFESSSLAAKHLPLPRLPVLLRDMYSEYVEDSHFSVSTSYAEIQTSDSLESTPALTKRNTLERATSTSMFAPDPRSPSDLISPITPTNSTLQLVKMEEMEGAASDRSSTFAISSTPLLRRCHIAGETGASAATSGIFEAAGSVLTESDERLAAAPARSQTLPQATHDVSRSELRSKPPLPRVFHKSSGSLKTKKQQPKKTHPARRAASGASLLSLFGFRRKATSLQKQQPTAAAMPQPHLTKISTLPVEKLEERQARAMGTGVSTTPGWSASLYSSMSGDLGEAVRAHDDTGATANEIDALATQKTHQSSVLPQASHTACAETTDQSMGAIVCAQAGLVHAAADEPHAASESDQPTLRLSTTEVILAGNEEMEPRQADAEDEVIGISEHKLQPFSSREEAEVTADNRSGSGYTPSRRRSSASGGEISASNDSSSDSVEASWYRPHFSASDQEVQGGRKKKAKQRRCTQAERKEDSNITAKAKELNDEDRTKQQTVTPSGKPNISILDASTENPHEFPSIIEKQLAQQTLADVNQTDKITPQQSDHEISRPQADRQTNEHPESSREEAMQQNPLKTAKKQNVDNESDNQKQAAKTENIAQTDDSTKVNIDEKNAEGMKHTASAEAGLDVDAGIVPEVSMKAGPVVVDVPTVDIQASVPGDVELPSLDVKAPDLDGEMNVKAAIEMPEAHLDIEPPAADMKVDAGGKFELPSLKVKLPHPHLKLGASGKAKAPKVDVEMPQAEADLDVSGKVDVPSTKVVIDADTDLDVDAGGKIGGIGKMGGFKVKMPHAHLKLGKSGKVKGPKVDVKMPELVVYSPDVSAPEPVLVSSDVFVSSAPVSCASVSVVDSRVRSAAVEFDGLDDVDHGSVPAVRAVVSVSTAPSSQLSPPISPLGLSESESSEVESASDTPPFSSPPEFWAHSVTPELGKSYGVHGGASLPRSKEEDLVVSEDLKKVGFRLRWPWSSQKVTPNVTPSLSSQQRKMSSSSSGVVEGSPPNKKRKRPLKPEKRKQKIAPEKPAPVGSLSRRDEDLGIQADISTTVQSSAPKFDDTLESGQKRDWSWKLGGRLQQPSAQVQVEEAQIVPLQSSTPSKAIAPDSRPKKHFAGLFKAKSTRKATATVDVREPLQVSIEMRKPSSSSRCSSTEQPQRQTWHAPSINDTEVDSERPPTPPLPCLPDADISKDLAVAYRRYYAYGSPLRRPRPWSTLDFPPRNCKFRNDDNLFPYAITPTKLPSCNWKTDEEYDVPYMDDDALPEEEPEWALGESRRTLTLATADVASFQTSLLAAGEPSEASFEKSPHTKKSLSLRAFSRSKKPAKEDRKTSKRTKSGMPNPEDRAPLQGPVDIEAPGGR